MNDSLILHHYDNSPYAEKVRLMFGLTDVRWSSLLSPAYPPRPNLDPLTGGYRRIPVAQAGADIFCDTALISREIAAISDCAALDVNRLDAEAAALMSQAETEAFFAAVVAVHPLRLMGSMMRMFGPVGTYQFVKDRAGFLKGGSVRPPQRKAAKVALASLCSALEARLETHQWLNGDSASIADLAAYHPLWLHLSCSGRPLNAGPKVEAWYRSVGAIGHGKREEISKDEVFSSARDSDPRPLPESVETGPVAIGTEVDVAPVDYGVVPVSGVLAAVTDNRIVVARGHTEFGTLHVHFPRAGYAITPK